MRRLELCNTRPLLGLLPGQITTIVVVVVTAPRIRLNTQYSVCIIFFFILGVYILQGLGKAKYQKVKVLSEVKRKFRTKPRAGILGPLSMIISKNFQTGGRGCAVKTWEKRVILFPFDDVNK